MQPEGPAFEPEPVLSNDPAAHKPFWTYIDFLLVIGLLFAAVVLILVVAGSAQLLIPKIAADTTLLLLPLQVLFYVCLYLIFQALFTLRYRRPALTSLGWVRSNFRLSWAVAGGIALAFAVAALAALLKTPKVQSPIEILMNSPVLLTCFGVMAVTLAPFFEELFFRGFLQPLLTRTFGMWRGIILTAIFFGGLHAPEYQYAWQYALAVSVVGVALGWVRVRAQSIVPPTIMHAAYNGVFVAALLITKIYPQS